MSIFAAANSCGQELCNEIVINLDEHIEILPNLYFTFIFLFVIFSLQHYCHFYLHFLLEGPRHFPPLYHLHCLSLSPHQQEQQHCIIILPP